MTKPNETDEMTVQDLIDELQKVPDKRQLVGETIITKVSAEKPTGWTALPRLIWYE